MGARRSALGCSLTHQIERRHDTGVPLRVNIYPFENVDQVFDGGVDGHDEAAVTAGKHLEY